MAKSQSQTLKKAEMSIKEKRALKRAKAADSVENIPRRKRPERS